MKTAGVAFSPSYARQARWTTVLLILGLGLLTVHLCREAYSALASSRAIRQDLERLVALPPSAISNAPSVPSGLARAPDAAGAGGALQDAVNRSAEAHGFRIENLQLLEPRPIGGLTRVSLRVNGTIPEQSALPFLAELAMASPNVMATTLELQKLPEMAFQAEGEQPTERMLAIRLELNALAEIGIEKDQP